MPENLASYFLLRCFKSASRCLGVRSWRSRGTLPARNGDFQKVKTSLSSNGSIGSLIRRHFLEETYVMWTEPDLSGLNSSKAKKGVKQLLERWEGERGYRKRLPSGRCTVNWQRECACRGRGACRFSIVLLCASIRSFIEALGWEFTYFRRIAAVSLISLT